MPIVDGSKVFQKAFAFRIEIEGVNSRGFAKVEGLTYRAPCSLNPVLKLERCKVVGDTDLVDWFHRRENGATITIAALDRDGYVVQRWGVQVAAYMECRFSDFNNSLDEHLMEVITVAHTGLKDLPLTQEDKDALFARIKTGADLCVEAAEQTKIDALSALEHAHASLVRAREYWETQQRLLTDSLNAAITTRDTVVARAQEEIAEARKKYAPASA